MAIKFYTVEKKINGKNYKAQFSGLSVALKAVDESYIDGSNNTSLEKWHSIFLIMLSLSLKDLPLTLSTIWTNLMRLSALPVR